MGPVHFALVPSSQLKVRWGAAASLLAGLLFPVLQVLGQTPSQVGGPSTQTLARSITATPPDSGRSTAGSVVGTGSQPLVTLQDGQLSIAVTNGSLSEVLFALRAATGADIDLPANASSERVTAHLGPGPARKVLSDFLSWSEFDYIIQGAEDDELAIQSVTLMARTKGAAPSAGATSFSPTRSTRSEPRGRETGASPAAIADSSETRAEPSNAASDALTPPPSTQPRVATTLANDAGFSANTPSGGAKSPSEMIQELQQMYQQRRQIQQQINQGQRSTP